MEINGSWCNKEVSETNKIHVHITGSCSPRSTPRWFSSNRGSGSSHQVTPACRNLSFQPQVWKNEQTLLRLALQRMGIKTTLKYKGARKYRVPVCTWKEERFGESIVSSTNYILLLMLCRHFVAGNIWAHFMFVHYTFNVYLFIHKPNYLFVQTHMSQPGQVGWESLPVIQKEELKIRLCDRKSKT